MDEINKIRKLCLVKGKSRYGVAKEFGRSWGTIDAIIKKSPEELLRGFSSLFGGEKRKMVFKSTKCREKLRCLLDKLGNLERFLLHYCLSVQLR